MKLFSRALCGALLCFSTLPALAQDEAPVAPLLQVPNGDMETGDDAPTGWRKDWVGKGELTLARDTATVHGGKAALRLEAKDARATAALTFDAPQGTTFRIGGWIKSAGNVKVSFGVSPRDKDRKKNGDNVQLAYLKDDQEWKLGEKTVTLPEGTQRVQVGVFVEGTGQVWLDDLTIEAVTATDAATDTK